MIEQIAMLLKMREKRRMSLYTSLIDIFGAFVWAMAGRGSRYVRAQVHAMNLEWCGGRERFCGSFWRK
jgi:hypothetical protein